MVPGPLVFYGIVYEGSQKIVKELVKESPEHRHTPGKNEA